MSIKLYQSWIDWMRDERWTIFGTLKFHNGDDMHVSRALKLARTYWQRVDTVHYASQVRRSGLRIERVVFLQMGKALDSTNTHFHFVANPPFPVAFCEIASQQWAELDRRCDSVRSWIEPARSSPRAAVYSARETFFDNLRAEASFRPELSHMARVNAALEHSIAERRVFQR